MELWMVLEATKDTYLAAIEMERFIDLRVSNLSHAEKLNSSTYKVEGGSFSKLFVKQLIVLYLRWLG